ncbi:hypothetical protein M441DRAFT_328310 [Trichoderma asperellum CBS 433.97]|uniref:Uncharacterized protein n=1 Tax=Trichoderma asperellum (strain ATCC 204424 / CBS 433.97 / NBRC 101777) TaxID=1042311 RepID=A0A2T3YSE8_TRIA4|nr:hypothetical protein M441DRAFT_328310 [Trichoderma asperellum CBS 433.97]PTB35449.1 hypothetical protein M441DRAFT_328310 [Trichoderma asperellum CBS 433.97]
MTQTTSSNLLWRRGARKDPERNSKKEGVEARAEEWVCEVEPCQYRSGSQGDYQHRWWWPKRRNVRRGGSSREQALSTYAILTCATVGRFAQMPISSLSRADRMPPPSAASATGLASLGGCRVCACFVPCTGVGRQLESQGGRKKSCERHGLARINPPSAPLGPVP